MSVAVPSTIFQAKHYVEPGRSYPDLVGMNKSLCLSRPIVNNIPWEPYEIFARLGSHMTGESLREDWSCNVPTDTCSPGAMPVCLPKYVLQK